MVLKWEKNQYQNIDREFLPCSFERGRDYTTQKIGSTIIQQSSETKWALQQDDSQSAKEYLKIQTEEKIQK